jgi:hypothetical protein
VNLAIGTGRQAELALEGAPHPRGVAEAALQGERLGGQGATRKQRPCLLDAQLVEELRRRGVKYVEYSPSSRLAGNEDAWVTASRLHRSRGLADRAAQEYAQRANG